MCKEGRHAAIGPSRVLVDNVTSRGIVQEFVKGGGIVAAVRDKNKRLEG